MTYEEICKALNRHNMETYETIEEQVEMLDPLMKGYERIEKTFRRFNRTLNLDDLAETARLLNNITGCGLTVER